VTRWLVGWLLLTFEYIQSRSGRCTHVHLLCRTDDHGDKTGIRKCMGTNSTGRSRQRDSNSVSTGHYSDRTTSQPGHQRPLRSIPRLGSGRSLGSLAQGGGAGASGRRLNSYTRLYKYACVSCSSLSSGLSLSQGTTVTLWGRTRGCFPTPSRHVSRTQRYPSDVY
jgi:hypothetical protein